MSNLAGTFGTSEFKAVVSSLIVQLAAVHQTAKAASMENRSSPAETTEALSARPRAGNPV